MVLPSGSATAQRIEGAGSGDGQCPSCGLSRTLRKSTTLLSAAEPVHFDVSKWSIQFWCISVLVLIARQVNLRFGAGGAMPIVRLVRTRYAISASQVRCSFSCESHIIVTSLLVSCFTQTFPCNGSKVYRM